MAKAGRYEVTEESNSLPEGLVIERPLFGSSQVLEPSELHHGKKYLWHMRGGKTEELTVAESVPSLRDGRWLRVIRHYSKQPRLGVVSLADCGVIPYKEGLWNATNWLEKLE